MRAGEPFSSLTPASHVTLGAPVATSARASKIKPTGDEGQGKLTPRRSEDQEFSRQGFCFRVLKVME
jgi:hypothetical protein